jgi:hypothetical protein
MPVCCRSIDFFEKLGRPPPPIWGQINSGVVGAFQGCIRMRIASWPRLCAGVDHDCPPWDRLIPVRPKKSASETFNGGDCDSAGTVPSSVQRASVGMAPGGQDRWRGR